MKRAVCTLFLMLSLTACGTIAGVGEDITGASRTVQGWF